MSRKRSKENKIVDPDPIYNSKIVTLLIRRVLRAGKKSLAQKIVYEALGIISSKVEGNPVLVLE
jgi:small subunit ribosomal protein S7